MSHRDLEATTNDKGWFRVERGLEKMVVFAHSKDNKLAGSVTISGNDIEATVQSCPPAWPKGN